MREHEDAVEADFQRYYNIDYRNRWNGDLSLRRISNLIEHLPIECATAASITDSTAGWTWEAHVIDDLRMAMTNSEKQQARPHPARVGKKKTDPQRDAKLRDLKARQEERKQLIPKGG